MLNRIVLRVALLQQGRTLKDVAQQAGLDLLRVYRITSNKARPRPDELKVLAEALGLSPEDLEGDTR